MLHLLLAFGLSLHCPKPLLINIRLDHRIDKVVLKRAPQKCRLLYQDRSPCLYKLERAPDTIEYYATCGTKVPEGEDE